MFITSPGNPVPTQKTRLDYTQSGKEALPACPGLDKGASLEIGSLSCFGITPVVARKCKLNSCQPAPGKAWKQAAHSCSFSRPGRVGEITQNTPPPSGLPLAFILSMEASNLSCCTVLLAWAMLLVLAVLLDIFDDSSFRKSEEKF